MSEWVQISWEHFAYSLTFHLLSIYLKDREFFYLLSRCWQQPGVGNPSCKLGIESRSSILAAGTQVFGSSTCCLPGWALAGSWNCNLSWTGMQAQVPLTHTMDGHPKWFLATVPTTPLILVFSKNCFIPFLMNYSLPFWYINQHSSQKT